MFDMSSVSLFVFVWRRSRSLLGGHRRSDGTRDRRVNFHLSSLWHGL